MYNLLQKTNSTDWDEVTLEGNMDVMWNKLHSKLLGLHYSAIPQKTVEMLPTDETWMTLLVTKALIMKNDQRTETRTGRGTTT